MTEKQRHKQTLSDFTRKAGEIVENLQRSGKPLFLTVRGKGDVVVQSADGYQRLVERVEVIEAIHRGLREIDEGKTSDAAEALDRIERKHGIKRVG